LIARYRATMEQVIAALSPANHALAVEIARVPEQIKGFGHVKQRNLAAAREQWDRLLAQWPQSRADRQVA
jgi:indolepyruvate ferredoxin oxidoreductase